MRRLIFIISIFNFSIVYGQQSDSTRVDIIDILLRKKSQSTKDKRLTKKIYFSLLPAAVNVPGGGKAVISAVNAAFYIGDPARTNLSNLYITPYTNFSNRYGLYLRSNLWLPENSFNLLGDYRIAHFPQYTWGLGGDTPELDRTLIDSDYVRFYQTIFKKMYGHWYLGPGYSLDHYYNIQETKYTDEGHVQKYGQDEYTSTISSGFTFNIQFDSRQNAINPQQGAYFLATWRWNAQDFGSTFNNKTLFLDGRKYIKVNKTRDNILAFHSFYWTILNGTAPYLDLPATNWAPTVGISGRGFETGRYRSNAIFYFEGEYRIQLTDNGLFGMVTFINLTSASEFESQNFQYWQAGAGLGMRIKFNKYSNSNLAIDFGFSQNYWGVWLNIGEMF